MQNLKTKLENELNKSKFGRHDKNTSPISNHRMIAIYGQIFILQKYIKQNSVKLKVYTLSPKLNYNYTTEITLMESEDFPFDIATSIYGEGSLEMYKHQRSSIISIIIKTKSNISPDLIFISIFNQQSFPSTFYRLKLGSIKILSAVYPQPSQQHMMILTHNNQIAIYDLWNNLNAPINSLDLNQLNINDSTDIAVMNRQSGTMQIFIANSEGKIYELKIHPISMTLQSNQLLYSSKNIKQQSPRSIIPIVFRSNPYFLLFQKSFNQIQITILIYTKGIMSTLSEFNVDNSASTQISNICKLEGLAHEQNDTIFSISNLVVRVEFKQTKQQEIQIVPKVILEIQNFGQFITLTNILGNLVLIRVKNSKVQVETIHIKTKNVTEQLQSLKLQNADHIGYQQNSLLNKNKKQLEKLKQTIKNTISNAKNNLQLKKAIVKSTNLIKYQSMKCQIISKIYIDRIKKVDSMNYDCTRQNIHSLSNQINQLKGKKMKSKKEDEIRNSFRQLRGSVDTIINNGRRQTQLEKIINDMRTEIRKLTISMRSND